MLKRLLLSSIILSSIVLSAQAIDINIPVQTQVLL